MAIDMKGEFIQTIKRGKPFEQLMWALNSNKDIDTLNGYTWMEKPNTDSKGRGRKKKK